jgi:hypothetical protein
VTPSGHVASVALIVALVGELGACREREASPKGDDPPQRCTCTPQNVARTKRVGDDHPIDGAGLVAMLRRHRQLIADNANRRDVKLVDDEIRIAVTAFCQPCGDWVDDRMTVDQMFPLARLDDATDAVCLGLTLRDGTIAYGDDRPSACR